MKHFSADAIPSVTLKRPEPWSTSTDPLGSVRVTPQVLGSIIELAALSIEGVARIAPVTSPWPRVLGGSRPHRGIAVSIRNATINIDLYLVLVPGVHMAQVGHAVQDKVAADIEQMLGMAVGEINIYIQDVA